jgi:hypothetical protein
MVFIFPSSSWVAKFKWPQEVVGFLEMWSNLMDLLNQVLNTGDTKLSKVLFNNSIISQRDSCSVDLSESSFVDKITDCLSIWVSVGDKRFNSLKHVKSGLVDSDEGSVVQLSQSEQSEDFLNSWVDVVDTLDSDNESNFGFWGDIEVSSVSCESFLLNEGLLSFDFSIVVFLSFGSPFFSFCFDLGLSLFSLLLKVSCFLLVSFLFLSKGFWYETKRK